MSPSVTFSVGDLAQISIYCLVKVHPETPLSQQRSTPTLFRGGHDPIAHARSARCPAHVGSILNECVIVSGTSTVSPWHVLVPLANPSSRDDITTDFQMPRGCGTPTRETTFRDPLKNSIVASENWDSNLV